MIHTPIASKSKRSLRKLATTGALLLGISLSLACGASADDAEGQGDNLGGEVICSPGETAPCYNGPSGTEDVGSCVAGVDTCNDDGTGWTGCVGEVNPIVEVCENGSDDDCNGAIDDVSDVDGDGFTRCNGDCCETSDQCDEPALVNPGAVEVIGEEGMPSADENCNGIVDEALALCDDALVLDDSDAVRAAAAIDICSSADNGAFGLVSAQYVRADGSAFTANLQHGLQSGFGPGVAPRLGNGMLALSTGAARSAGQPGSCGGLTCTNNANGTAPAGFPQDVPGCDGGTDIHDDVALELTLRAPANASGYSFDFMFYTFEYPEWVCTTFNDQFVAIVDPAPEGSINGNIAFDSMTNPVSVNIAFFDVCEGCANGTAELMGTGFDTWNDAGATSWLRTQAPIQGGEEFTIRFAIWDTGDAAWDSTVLIDNFQWLAEPVGVTTNPID